MELCTIGAYWRNRELSMGEYHDFLLGLLTILRSKSSAFSKLYEVHDEATAPRLDSDLRNLKDFVRLYSCRTSDIIDDGANDNVSIWERKSEIGFRLSFSSDSLSRKDGLYVSLGAGKTCNFTPNSLIITYPLEPTTLFSFPEFNKYEFVADLFGEIIRFVRPDRGLVTTDEFSLAIKPQDVYYVGWLTYISRSPGEAITNEFETISIGCEGVLFTLGKENFLLNSPRSVETGLNLYKAINNCFKA